MTGTTLPQGFSRYPMLWLAVWFAAGIVIERHFSISAETILIVVAFAFIGCAIAKNLAALLLPCLFLSLGVLAACTASYVDENRIKRIYDDGRILSGEPVEIEGVLIRSREPTYDGSFLVVAVEKLQFKESEQAVSGTVRLFLSGIGPTVDTGAGELNYGSRVRVFCRLQREERYQNPGVASQIQLLDQQGIDATAIVKSPRLIEKLGDEPVLLPTAWIFEQRQRLIERLRADLSPPAAGVMIASLLGNQYFLDRDTSEAFRDGGTFHVLVISGLHITFIGGLMIWVVSIFTRRKRTQFIMSTSLLWAYTIAVGAQVPVVRASLMFTFLLFAHLVHRTGSQLNILGLCALILLAWRPADLFSASFQLTLVSVAAIVGCSFPLIEKLRAIGSWMPTAEAPFPPDVSKSVKHLCEFFYWNEVRWRIQNGRQIWTANLYKTSHPILHEHPNLQLLVARIFEAVLVSVVVQLWMLPVVVIYFHRVPLASVPLNLWVGLFLALESFCCLGVVLLGSVSEWLATPLISSTEWLNSAMMWLPELLSESRRASIRVPVYSGGYEIIYVLFGIAILTAAYSLFKWTPFDPISHWRRHGRVFAISVAMGVILAIVIVTHPASAPSPDGKLTVDFLDVGQGDSALVTFPNGEAMLVDGGGEIDFRDDAADENEFEPDRRRIGEAVVSEFLWSRGYSHVDYIVATHADADHMQGLIDVARNFDIGLVLVGSEPLDDREFAMLLRTVNERGIKMASVSRGDDLSIGGVSVDVLSPYPTQLGESSNNSSVVMKLSYGSRSILMTGDIERQAEARLVSDSAADLKADVVKVPHHGSRTSSSAEFVGSVEASVVVISVGRRSRFGHPHAEVLSRWHETGARVVKTGDTGTITVSTDGHELNLRTFVP